MPRDLNGLTLAFDLDGTLIDTAPDLVATAQDVLARNGLDPVAPEILLPEISFGSRRMMERALETLDADRASTRLDRLFDEFLEIYVANISRHSTPFQHVLDVIERAQSDGARVVVCTNKRENLARMLFDDLGITGRFAWIAGRDTYAYCKPDPRHLTHAITDGGGDPHRAIMIGDSDTDVKTAKAARIPVIGVTFGYTAIPVTDLDCDAVISDYAQFDDALEGILAAA